jgi:hypothetical protein
LQTLVIDLAVWPGREQGHFLKLQEAVEHNTSDGCGCKLTPPQQCPAHDMLADRRQLSYLAFVKEFEDRTGSLWRSEWTS